VKGLIRERGSEQATVVARLSGCDTCCCESIGLTVTSPSPILSLCRALVERDVDPNTALHVYRGATLTLIVTGIGKGARLEVRGDGVGFRPSAKLGAASTAANSGIARPTAPGSPVAPSAPASTTGQRARRRAAA
jgi:hypothetical protein